MTHSMATKQMNLKLDILVSFTIWICNIKEIFENSSPKRVKKGAENQNTPLFTLLIIRNYYMNHKKLCNYLVIAHFVHLLKITFTW